MRYWFDTEFIEDGKTIDLISIGIVDENGSKLYLQRPEADFDKADDWLMRNVLLNLEHFDLASRSRSCWPRPTELNKPQDGRCSDSCPWRDPEHFKKDILRFIENSEKRPEFWAYYADYDWVVLCQVFGRMIDLPKGWPMFCMDIKQLCVEKGDPKLPEQGKGEHNALADALWNKQAWEFLQEYQKPDSKNLL